MAIKAILFDLDGTLLPMEDQDRFIKTYFHSLTEYMAAYGYDKDEFVSAMWQSVGAMMKNDGSDINETAFWREFVKIYGERGAADKVHVDDFYKNRFSDAKVTCGYTARAKETLELVKELGFRAVLATNPVFPRVATEARIGWAGLIPEDFELITTYENSSYTKPRRGYYGEILDALGLTPEECVMVGNDTRDDMSAEALGMRVFLLTDCLINESGADISRYPHGDFSALAEYLRSLN